MNYCGSDASRGLRKIEKMKTISFAGVAKYAKVSERLKHFHESHSGAFFIDTECFEINGGVCFKAMIKNKDLNMYETWTGHAWTKGTGKKDFEKCETIAVGRALALFGIMSDGSIASHEEMADIEDPIDIERALLRLDELVETSHAESDVLEQIEQHKGSWGLERIEKAIRFLQDIERKKQREDNPSMTQINEKVKEKLDDPKA